MNQVAAELRAATRVEHRRVEVALGLPWSVVDDVDLAAVLHGLLAVWEPLERGLAAVDGWAHRGLDPHLGEAAGLLRADLEALGEPAGPPRRVRIVPGDLATATGMRYVLLGSALGGPVVAAGLEGTIGPPARCASRFFGRAGLEPAEDWRHLRAALAMPWTVAERASMIVGARRAFAMVATSRATVEARRRAAGTPRQEPA